jgi:exodeoxyribonuclease-3
MLFDKNFMKIISWNVNGIRAVAKKGFADFLRSEKPDVICLQEIKIDDAARAKVQFDFAGYEEYWNPAQRKGYSGTAMLVKSGKLKVESFRNGIGVEKFDCEGRVQTVELEKFYLVNTYYPNANHELSRLGYKLDFNKAILKYLKKLEAKKPVVICGDLNVAHEEIDLARPKENIGNPGFTNEERESMTKFLLAGFADTFRRLHPDKIQYSWWGYRFGLRARNIGWRIDYFCASEILVGKIKKSFILDQVQGSDHCPVGVEIEL